MDYINLKTKDNGIVILEWDHPTQSTNVLNEDSLSDFKTKLEQALKQSCKGIILTSTKSTFSAGADLNYIQEVITRPDPHKELFNAIMTIQQLFRTLETSNTPIVAAINGSCLGGGFELALACHHRIMANNSSARIGLPEVKLGILPGLGGTCRLVRNLGSEGALKLILRGSLLPPQAALKQGLVHQVAEQDDLIDKASEWIMGNPTAKQPWDLPKFRIPGGPPYSKNGLMIWGGANGILRQQTFGRYPGARAAMAAIYEGLLVDFDQALEIEAQYFTQTFLKPEAQAMVKSLFTTRSQIKKGIHRPKNIPFSPTSKLGILGSGFMGQGIAHVASKAGIDVILIDQAEDLAKKGLENISQAFQKQVKQGRMHSDSATKTLERITATSDYSLLKGCDLVIEAVFENRKIKQQAYEKALQHINHDTIMGSNTSTLPISGLAQSLPQPNQMIGIHFFSPVDKMDLVEVILGKKTDDRSLAKALDFLKQLNKTPIVVNDGRGFYTTRCVISYINEGLQMITEGIPAPLIENGAKMLGMPVGPLALIDEIAIELAYLIRKQTQEDLGKDFEDDPSGPLIATMVEKYQRLGRKNQKGFYDYTPTGKTLWPELKQWEHSSPPSLESIQDRLMYRQIAEVLKCEKQGIILDDRDADIGAIFGWGFLPWTGGPMSWVNQQGRAFIGKKLKLLATEHGQRFSI
ncbi:MAG TPA: 3-hydroxyacyl-CoA dehydrogenase NAD-binding domain-containing protein [Gammaproteobacteria bacterium]|nr:3-hydroxyacyl-CoA dehydrogenase NAD-binding domain-containing protein [Gammaproteobacteria bacterium]